MSLVGGELCNGWVWGILGGMYERIARYYDLTHQGLTEDIGFLVGLSGRVVGPVLELGCGSGRVLLPLARAGQQVVGLDNSPAMLARAWQKLAAEVASGRVRLVEGNMAHFELGEAHFGLAIVAYNTFLHLSPAEMGQALRAIRRCLRPAGQMFIDLANPFVVAQTPNDRFLTLEQLVPDPETGQTLLVMASNWLNPDEQQLKITWIYDSSDPAGGPIQRTIAQATYHYLYPHEIELLLAESGFKLLALYGDYDQSPFEEDSPRLLVLAQAN